MNIADYDCTAQDLYDSLCCSYQYDQMQAADNTYVSMILFGAMLPNSHSHDMQQVQDQVDVDVDNSTMLCISADLSLHCKNTQHIATVILPPSKSCKVSESHVSKTKNSLCPNTEWRS